MLIEARKKGVAGDVTTDRRFKSHPRLQRINLVAKNFGKTKP
jgi:hypothetical protein